MSGLMPSTVDYVHRHEILPLLGEQFKRLDPSFDENRKSRKAILAFLLKELASLQKSGYPMSASEQILLEAKWLINYTIRWPEADKRLEDARRSLCNLKQDALVQGNDGAFDSGACNTPYRKFEPTVDALQDRNLNPATLRPLTFMKDFLDPKHLLDRLWDLQITDVAATEYNGRDELGATQSAFSQLIFKDNLRALLDPPASNLDFRISPALEDSYLDFMRQTQHPRTGYWGPWYRIGGKLLIVQDLSFTFHQINYRQGNVELWPQIIETTLNIKDLSYPLGWKELDSQKRKFNSNHHNYDVAQIFAYGWSHMTRKQKERARIELNRMLAWCITESLTADGTFDCDASDESYYFGVRFLDRVGFFDESKRFWTKGVPDLPRGAPEPGDVAARLAAALKSTGNESNTADDAMKILRTAECLSAIPRSIRELAKESAKPAQHGAGRLDSPECLGANCGGELKSVCERASL